MQCYCIFTQDENPRQVWKFRGSVRLESARASEDTQSFRQGDPGGDGACNDEDRVIAGDRAEHFGKLFLIDRLSDGLRPARDRMKDDELADAVHLGEQLG